MGLVTCSKCGKIYDYDKYNGICPKCARYNKETTAAQEHQEYHDKYDGGYSHTAQDDHYSYHQRYDDDKNPHSGQLDGIQMTLQEVMGAEHKVDLERKDLQNTDKRKKIILSVFVAVIAINVLLSGGVLLLPLIIGLAVWYKSKKK